VVARCSPIRGIRDCFQRRKRVEFRFRRLVSFDGISENEREGASSRRRAKPREGSGVYQQAARSIWGEEYVQSRESFSLSLSSRTCVHPCLSRQEYRLWRTSRRARRSACSDLVKIAPRRRNRRRIWVQNRNRDSRDAGGKIPRAVACRGIFPASPRNARARKLTRVSAGEGEGEGEKPRIKLDRVRERDARLFRHRDNSSLDSFATYARTCVRVNGRPRNSAVICAERVAERREGSN